MSADGGRLPEKGHLEGPRIGELFAGYGGLGMGVQAALGGRIAWVSEYDKGPSKILAHRFPGVPNHGDITTIDWSQVEPVDVLTGGSPCQDLSNAGKRAGMTDGTRSNLWVAMREAIAQLRPSLVVWENVRGAYSACADSDLGRCPRCVDPSHTGGHAPVLRALGRVLGDLSDVGYDARWHGIRAADVGGPHGRFRVFVAAYPNGQGCGGFGRQFAQRCDPDGRGRANELRPPQESTALLPTPAVNDMGEGKTVEQWDAWTAKMKAAHGNGNGHGNSLSIEAQRLLPTPRAGDGEKGGPNQAGSSGDLMLPSAVQPQRWGAYGAVVTRWEHLTRSAPDPTEDGPKGSPRLSAAFSEWMMGLPAGWVTDVPGITRNEALKALGNGVVPQQAAAALREMFAWDDVAA